MREKKYLLELGEKGSLSFVSGDVMSNDYVTLVKGTNSLILIVFLKFNLKKR